MSEGSRSGVNWIRRTEQSIERASALASMVLPTPGHVLDQQVALGEQHHQGEVDRAALALDDALDGRPDPTHHLDHVAEGVRPRCSSRRFVVVAAARCPSVRRASMAHCRVLRCRRTCPALRGSFGHCWPASPASSVAARPVDRSAGRFSCRRACRGDRQGSVDLIKWGSWWRKVEYSGAKWRTADCRGDEEGGPCSSAPTPRSSTRRAGCSSRRSSATSWRRPGDHPGPGALPGRLAARAAFVELAQAVRSASSSQQHARDYQRMLARAPRTRRRTSRAASRSRRTCGRTPGWTRTASWSGPSTGSRSGTPRRWEQYSAEQESAFADLSEEVFPGL